MTGDYAPYPIVGQRSQVFLQLFLTDGSQQSHLFLKMEFKWYLESAALFC